MGAATLAKVREDGRNEDRYFIDNINNTFGVFDGVSGERGKGRGDIASEAASKFVQEELSKLPDEMTEKDAKQEMDRILRTADKKVYEKGSEFAGSEAVEKPSTTASVVKILKDGKAIIGNVGDSRVYRLKQGSKSLEHLALDDSQYTKKIDFPEEQQWEHQIEIANLDTFKAVPTEIPIIAINERNGIGQALGGGELINPNIYTCNLEPGDRLIITSDGVHDTLTDGHTADCLLEHNNDSKQASNAILQAAKAVSDQFDTEKPWQRSKPDDITVIVYEYPGEGKNKA